MTIEELPEPYASHIERVAPRHPHAIRVERVRYELDGVALEGFLAAPDGPVGGRKAVVIHHAWMGVAENVEMRARMLARLGYTAFAADIYGAGVRPKTFPEMAAESQKYYDDLSLMRARATAGFDVLVDRGFAPEDIVVIGYCFGGTAALEFARTGRRCAGVVSFHGRLLVHEPSDAKAIDAPVLILTGADDDIVPDSEVTAFMDDLRTAPALDWQVSIYAGAPHAFTVPGERYHPAADARSWREFLGFLDEFAPVG